MNVYGEFFINFRLSVAIKLDDYSILSLMQGISSDIEHLK